MKRHIRRKLVIPEDVLDIVQILVRCGHRGYVVGGAVRDLLRGVAVSDWDLATDAQPDRVAGLFAKVVPTGIRHGTVTVICRTSQYEITTFRTDGDYAGQSRLKKSAVTRNIEEDLRHRDFTINAMAYDPLTQNLIDPFGGLRDIKVGIIRGVENPVDRFMEDGLRPYRAIRFAVVLNYRIDEKTLKAIPLALDKVREVSWERIRDEILKMLAARSPSTGFEMMRETGLLSLALPELLEGYRTRDEHGGDLYHHQIATVDAAPPHPLLRLACLLHDIGKARGPTFTKLAPFSQTRKQTSACVAETIGKRLRLSNDQRKYIHQLIENHEKVLKEISPDPAQLRRFLSKIDRKLLDDLFDLSIAHMKASGAPLSEILKTRRLRKRTHEILAARPPLTVSDLAITGHTVKEILGTEGGIHVGRILERLLDIVLEDPEKNNPRDLAELVREVGGR